jgi:hypothetical protein
MKIRELFEDGTSGGTSSGAIATVAAPMGKKPIKREGLANWDVKVQSMPKPPGKLKKIVVKTNHGKTYTFDTEAEARSMFPDSWDKIKAGLPGFEVTGLSEAVRPNKSRVIQTDSGTAKLTDKGVIFDNSGYTDSFTWDEINRMNNGEDVDGWYLEKDDPYTPADVYCYTSGAEVEYHLPKSAVPKTISESIKKTRR